MAVTTQVQILDRTNPFFVALNERAPRLLVLGAYENIHFLGPARSAANAEIHSRVVHVAEVLRIPERHSCTKRIFLLVV